MTVQVKNFRSRLYDNILTNFNARNIYIQVINRKLLTKDYSVLLFLRYIMHVFV